MLQALWVTWDSLLWFGSPVYVTGHKQIWISASVQQMLFNCGRSARWRKEEIMLQNQRPLSFLSSFCHLANYWIPGSTDFFFCICLAYLLEFFSSCTASCIPNYFTTNLRNFVIPKAGQLPAVSTASRAMANKMLLWLFWKLYTAD